MRIVNAGTDEGGYVDGLIPEVAQELSWGALESREKVEAELDLILLRLRDMYAMEPDQAMRTLSAASARLTEMCVHLQRLETRREWRQVRTLQAERILQECDRQWKTASRMLEMRRQDIDLSR